MLSNYKKWTGKEREVSYKITKKAMKDGVIPLPMKCNRCGQTGILGSATIYDKILLCQELKELMLVDMSIMY